MNDKQLYDIVSDLLKAQGHEVVRLTQLGGGSNHYVFEAETAQGRELIIKYPRIRETEAKYQQAHEDTLFGGRLSMQREAYLFGEVRRGGVAAPEVDGVFDTPAGQCIVVDRSPGVSLPEYMEAEGHSLEKFLGVMACLGRDFRTLHKTTRYASFGNIMDGGEIEPAGIMNFADRYLPINDRLMGICKAKNGLTDAEFDHVKAFFDRRFEELRPRLDAKNDPPTLVITDMHGGNFFVKDGVVSGYFDVESSQAAPAMFELYALRFFVFNFYGEEEFRLAEEAFWTAYHNGQRNAPTPEEDDLLDFFTACRLLEIFQSYWGYIDGLRDTWGQRIKDILMNYIATGKVDYIALGAIWRERDGQPERAAK